jgi:hypothetical protein
MALTIGFFVSIQLLIIALLLQKGKAYDLIAGYNTLSETEKKKIDIEAVAKKAVVSLYVFIFLILALTATLQFVPMTKEQVLLLVSVFIAVVAIVINILVFFANRGRFNKKLIALLFIVDLTFLVLLVCLQVL